MPIDSDYLGRYDPVDNPAIAETTRQRLEYRNSQKFLVDTIFPAGAMHLIGGPSGVGKTTWLMQMLWEWEQERKLFGDYQAHACPWVYLGCDRSLREFDATLCRLGYGKWEFEAHALESLLYTKGKPFQSPDFGTHVLKRFPRAELIVVEGLQALMPDNSKTRSQNKNELIWALEQRHVLAQQNKTVIATTHNPKVGQMGTSTTDERSKFLGSQGFIGSCSTMIGFEKDTNALVDGRKVTIMGRNFKDLHLKYVVGEAGEFILDVNGDSPVETEEDREMQFKLWCVGQKTPFSVGDAVAYVLREGLGISDATVERWLKDECTRDGGKLERFKDGKKNMHRRRKLETVRKAQDASVDGSGPVTPPTP